MKKTKEAVANLGAEELARMEHIVLTRADVRSAADALFGSTASEARKKDQELIAKLFLQSPAAETMTHNLNKVAAAAEGNLELVKQIEKIAVAKNVIEFFDNGDHLTTAQKLYPELLKVAKVKVNG